MKLNTRFSQLSVFFLLLLFLQISNVFAQNEDLPWQFSFGINAVDTFPTATANNGDLFEDFFNVTDHWNYGSIPVYLGLTNYLGRGFSFGGRFSFNKITHYGNLAGDDNYYNLDVQLKYDLNKLIKIEKFHPFMDIGGGYAIFDTTGAGYFNLGAGIEYLVGQQQRTVLQLGSVFKNTGENYGTKHFQHYLGVGFLFGNLDSDGDGILDKEDKCPETPGIIEFQGCPDTDGDGIKDSEDKCPEIPGILEFQGCPDTDGDGIPDSVDECPDVPGLAIFEGCPDKDEDGVKDAEDECPEIAGTIENNGCPEITKEVIEQIAEIGQRIYFDTNKSTLKSESIPVLNEVLSILKKYPNYKIRVQGHTDSDGREAHNLTLSRNRASTVAVFLISHGIDRNRVSSEGYGESRPIATNNTAPGKQLNRRVEFNLFK